MATKILNRTQLAEWLDKDPKTIDAWVRDGCPFVQRGGQGKPWKFSMADVNDWRVADATARAKAADDDPDMAELEWRHEYAKTVLAELKLAKEKGQVAYIDEFEAGLSQMYGAINSRLRNLPKRISGRVAAEKEPRKVRDYMLGEVDLILTELSDLEILLPDGTTHEI